MAANYLISIIMPTYNRSYIIERAIKSVINQTYQNWELIIVDDGSTDRTGDIVKGIGDQRIIYLQNEINRGANFARNRGVDNASGEFVAFIDSDNYWPANKLELQVKQLQECKDAPFFLYGKIKITDGQSERIVPEQNNVNLQLKKEELRYNQIDTNTIMLRRNLFQQVGGFDEKIPRLQDWEFVLNLLWKNSCKAYFCEEILSYNELQSDSISRNQEKLWLAYKRIMEKYMLEYLDEKEIANKLVLLYKLFPSRKDEITCLIQDINCDKTKLSVYMFEECIKCEDCLMKSWSMQSLLYLWQMKNNENNGNVFRKYFYQGSPYKNIAIYGVGNVATLFMGAIKELPVNLLCGIDKYKRQHEELMIVSPENIPKVDVVIVTVSYDADQIKQELMNTTENKIVTLKELLD